MKNFIVLCFMVTILLKQSFSSVSQNECTVDLDCGTEGAICKNVACTCPPDYVVNSDRTRCLLESYGYGGKCEDNAQCSSVLKAGGQCHGGMCRCAAGFHYHLGRCFRSTGLGENCRTNNNCFSNYDFYSTSCSTDKKCHCSEGYYLREYSSCRKASNKPGEPCGISQDCHFPNAVCTMSRICAYTNTTLPTPWSSLELNESRQKRKISLGNYIKSTATVGSECQASKDCGTFAYCSSGGRCLCLPGYYVSDDKNACHPEIGAACTRDDCKGRNTMCHNGNECSCKPGFVARPDNRLCLKLSRNIGWSCLHDIQCSFFGESGQCVNKKCACKVGTHFEKAHLFCWRNQDVGENCTIEEDCRSEGKTCFQGKCSCSDDYHPAENNSICRQKALYPGDNCIDDSDCVFEHSTCISDTCQCIGGYFPNKDKKCSTGIGGICKENTDCFASNSICTKGICGCPEDYVGNKDSSTCYEVSKRYSSPCVEDTQCTTSLGSLAACIEGSCICADNSHFYKEDSWYDSIGQCYHTRLLGQNCTRAAQCTEENDHGSTRVECRKGICNCRYEYTYDTTYRTCSGASFVSLNILLLATSLSSVFGL